jgi:GDPmannose 4,6-dehydratase
MKKVLVTGITGQDGSHLAELLLNKGYEVHGILRRSSTNNRHNIDHLTRDPSVLRKSLFLHYSDMTDALSLTRIVDQVQPDEVYNLAAQSHVGISFDVPDYTAQVDGLGTIRLLGAIHDSGCNPRFYQASTSELYGRVQETPQKETTPFYPRSPYAVAKLYSYWITINYREAYDMYACNGILFNHEGERRGENFVTRKISRSVGRIKYGLQDCLYLGNLAAKRDWGYAPDFVYGMWLMLQQDKPDDYVLATGETHTIEEFCEEAFAYADMPIVFEGEGVDRVGRLADNGRIVVQVDPRYFRPTDVELLLGDYTKAKTCLGWKPTVTFDRLVQIMTKHDIELARKESL